MKICLAGTGAMGEIHAKALRHSICEHDLLTLYE